MPNRIIKESICDDEKVAQLKDFEFRLWIGLITQADDAGRGDARPAIIKGRVFPLRDQVTVRIISDGLHALATIGLIDLYKVGGRLYYVLPSWSKHQRIRDCKPKYPAPEDADRENDNPPQVAASCGELPQVASRARGESESNTNPNPIQSEEDSAEPQAVSAPPAIFLPLNDGTDYPVPVEQCQEWAGLYPAVDVIQQLRNMRGWLDANPAKRKTKRGINAFIVRWLAKEQDKGRTASAPVGRAAKPGYGVQAHQGELGALERAAVEKMLKGGTP